MEFSTGIIRDIDTSRPGGQRDSALALKGMCWKLKYLYIERQVAFSLTTDVRISTTINTSTVYCGERQKKKKYIERKAPSVREAKFDGKEVHEQRKHCPNVR